MLFSYTNLLQFKQIFSNYARSERSEQLLAFKCENFVTVEPKTATSPCVHYEVAASPTEKKTSLLHVFILSHFEIVEIIGPNTREIT